MANYRHDLPQLNGAIFLTDGGMETTLIFHNKLDLPYFAAFDLLKDDQGYRALHDYYVSYIALAKTHQVGFILESATWRASSDWGEKLGYSSEMLADTNRRAIVLLKNIRDEYASAPTPIVISGCIGPRGDAYRPSHQMSSAEAQHYHVTQIATFSETAADMITALSISYVEEAIGVINAAQSVGMPVVISFTVETDGRLPTGQTLKQAVKQVDEATNEGPVYYMINCAHPLHFEHLLANDERWTQRISGIRANASTKSHAELDESEELDDGNPVDLGQNYQDLRNRLPHLNVLGGCCGTDPRHLAAICNACFPPR